MTEGMDVTLAGFAYIGNMLIKCNVSLLSKVTPRLLIVDEG